MHKELADGIVDFIKLSHNISKDEEEILKYGAEIIFLNMGKLMVVYFVAYLLQIHYFVLGVNIGFSLLRTFAYGVHADTSLKCTVSMIILFIGTAGLGLTVTEKIFPYVWGIGFIVCVLLLLLFSPAGTKKRPFHDIRLIRKKKIESFIVFILVCAFVYRIPISIEIKNMIFLGMVLECISLTPPMYKLLSGSFSRG